MSKTSFSNSISLSSIFNDVVDAVYTSATTTTTSADVVGSILYYDYTAPIKNNLWQLVEDFTYPIITTPPYPVSNYSVDENLTSIISIAVSGFSDEEITIKREDMKLIVEGKKSKEREKEDKRKYFYKNIAERDFRLSYDGSDKWDFDKLEAKMSKGILNIEIPLKEEHKPVKQEFKIRK